MQGSNRKARRAADQEQARTQRRLRRSLLATGATLAISMGAFGGVAQAEVAAIQAGQIAQNNYTALENLIVVSDNLGRIQIALLAPAAELLPDGWVPVVTSGVSTQTSQVNFFAALGSAAGMVVAVPDTSHVPGLPSLGNAGLLPAQLLAGEPLLGAAADGVGVQAQIVQALARLGLINLETLGQNLGAEAEDFLGGDKVEQQAGQLGLPNLEEALNFFSGTSTSSSWTGSIDWAALGIKGESWITQDRLTVDSLTSDDLKDKFSENIDPADPLIVAEGSSDLEQVGTRTAVITPEIPRTCVNIPFVGQQCVGPFPAVTEELPVYDYVWTGDTDENGEQLYTVTYDPNAGVAGALDALDGVDTPGFSIIKNEIGGSYSGPGDSLLGWLGATTQVIVPGTDGEPDTVATVPLLAAGLTAPSGLGTFGAQYSPGLITNGEQSISSVLGSRSSSFSLPLLGVGVEQTSFLESGYLGPDGVALNSGWTLANITIGDTTIPVVYSLGSVNFGPNGVGFTGPSVFGVGLPAFQLGTTPAGADGGDGLAGLIGGLDVPTSVIVLDPKLLFEALGITDPTGLGLTDPFGTSQAFLSPLFTEYVTPLATQLAQALADAGVQLVNSASGEVAELSGQLVGATGQAADEAEDLSDEIVAQYPMEINGADPIPLIELRGDDGEVTPLDTGTVDNEPAEAAPSTTETTGTGAEEPGGADDGGADGGDAPAEPAGGDTGEAPAEDAPVEQEPAA